MRVLAVASGVILLITSPLESMTNQIFNNLSKKIATSIQDKFFPNHQSIQF